MKITIAGEERPYVLNMGALQAISERGYSGEGDQGDFGAAFAKAESGDTEAMRLVVWAGLLSPFMDDYGVIDFDSAPPPSILNRMSLAELMNATVTASAAFIEQLPAGTIEAAEKAAQAQEKAREAAEKAGRPTTPRAKSKA